MPPEITTNIRSLEQLEKENPNDTEVLLNLAEAYLYAAPFGRPARQNETDYAHLAEMCLDKALAVDSSNCDVWRRYAREYYRMHYDSFGPAFWQRFEIRGRQREIVELGCRFCPDDKDFELWRELLGGGRWEPPEEIGYTVVEQMGRQVIRLNDSGRDLGPVLQDHEVKTMDKYYRRTKSVDGVPCFELKSAHLSRAEKDQIIRILERRFRYGDHRRSALVSELYRHR